MAWEDEIITGNNQPELHLSDREIEQEYSYLKDYLREQGLDLTKEEDLAGLQQISGETAIPVERGGNEKAFRKKLVEGIHSGNIFFHRENEMAPRQIRRSNDGKYSVSEPLDQIEAPKAFGSMKKPNIFIRILNNVFGLFQERMDAYKAQKIPEKPNIFVRKLNQWFGLFPKRMEKYNRAVERWRANINTVSRYENLKKIFRLSEQQKGKTPEKSEQLTRQRQPQAQAAAAEAEREPLQAKAPEAEREPSQVQAPEAGKEQPQAKAPEAGEKQPQMGTDPRDAEIAALKEHVQALWGQIDVMQEQMQNMQKQLQASKQTENTNQVQNTEPVQDVQPIQKESPIQDILPIQDEPLIQSESPVQDVQPFRSARRAAQRALGQEPEQERMQRTSPGPQEAQREEYRKPPEQQAPKKESPKMTPGLADAGQQIREIDKMQQAIVQLGPDWKKNVLTVAALAENGKDLKNIFDYAAGRSKNSGEAGKALQDAIQRTEKLQKENDKDGMARMLANGLQNAVELYENNTLMGANAVVQGKCCGQMLQMIQKDPEIAKIATERYGLQEDLMQRARGASYCSELYDSGLRAKEKLFQAAQKPGKWIDNAGGIGEARALSTKVMAMEAVQTDKLSQYMAYRQAPGIPLEKGPTQFQQYVGKMEDIALVNRKMNSMIGRRMGGEATLRRMTNRDITDSLGSQDPMHGMNRMVGQIRRKAAAQQQANMQRQKNQMSHKPPQNTAQAAH